MKAPLILLSLSAAIAAGASAWSTGETVEGNCDPPTAHAPLHQSPSPLLKATVTEQAMEQPKPSRKPSAAQIRAQAAWMEKFKHPNSGIVIPGQAITTVTPPLPAAGQPAGTRALPAVSRPAGSRSLPATAQPANSTKQLPRWGDKTCLCHEGFRLFKQHRFLESAQCYRKAGDTMLAAWGHENNDVGNARRGEAVAYGAAGQWSKAETLYKEAIRIYISSSTGHPSDQLQGTILDLADTLKNERKATAAKKINNSCAQICNLARVNPAQAAKQFATLSDSF